MKQETAGAMMAATWGEITGSPGVSVSTRGPGAANMVNGVAHAWMDRAPLIVINDQYPGATYETGMRQVLNQHALFAPITKWQSTIHARSVRQQIRRAIRVTTTPTPGPVQFDMPSNPLNVPGAHSRGNTFATPGQWWPRGHLAAMTAVGQKCPVGHAPLPSGAAEPAGQKYPS